MKKILAVLILAVMMGIALVVVGLSTSHAREADLRLRTARAWRVSCDSSAIPRETLSLTARA
jgi:hypothetical protein